MKQDRDFDDPDVDYATPRTTKVSTSITFEQFVKQNFYL